MLNFRSPYILVVTKSASRHMHRTPRMPEPATKVDVVVREMKANEEDDVIALIWDRMWVRTAHNTILSMMKRIWFLSLLVLISMVLFQVTRSAGISLIGGIFVPQILAYIVGRYFVLRYIWNRYRRYDLQVG